MPGLDKNAFYSMLLKNNEHYRNDEIEVIWEPYKNLNSKLRCRCLKCGREWEAAVNSLLNVGTGCRICNNTNLCTNENFYEKLKQKNSHYANNEITVDGYYENVNSEMKCHCNVCGYDWTCKAISLLHNHSCLKCGGTIQVSHKEFLDKVLDKNTHYKNGEFEIISEYQGTSKPIQCRCLVNKDHGVWENKTAAALLQNCACPICKKEKEKLTPESFLEKLAQRNSHYSNNEFILLEGYTGIKNRIKCRCNLCGNEWSPVANGILNLNSGCPACSSRSKITNEQFIERVKEINKSVESGRIRIIDKYEGTNKPVTLLCTECGFTWKAGAGNVIKGTSGKTCPKCDRPRKLSHEQFIEQLSKKNVFYRNGDFIVLGKYTSSLKPIKCKCVKCGYEWSPKANSILQSNSSCPRCHTTGTSFMEIFIIEALRQYFPNVNIIERDRSLLKGKEIDILIPELKVSIEPGSWYFHKPKWREDLEKKKAMENLGYKHIIIYDSFDGIDELGNHIDFPNEDNIFCYTYDFGQNPNELIQIVYLLLGIIQYPESYWPTIEKNVIERLH